MLDIKFVCDNPELVKENIRKKFKDAKLPLVDEAVELYTRKCAANTRANELRANRNKISKEIGVLMGKGLRDEAEEKKKLVGEQAKELATLETEETEIEARLKEVMMKIPNIIDDPSYLKAAAMTEPRWQDCMEVNNTQGTEPEWTKKDGVLLSDIVYDSSRDENNSFDLYIPKTASKTGDNGVMLFIHGGGWSDGEKSDMAYLAKRFARKGFITATLDYRLFPTNVNYLLGKRADFTMDDLLADVDQSIAKMKSVLDKKGYQANKLGLCGYSAGGHMALLYTGLQNSEAFQEKIGVKVPKTKVRATAGSCPVGSYVANDVVSKVFKNLSGRLYDDEMKLAYSYEGFADETYPEVCIVTTKTDVPIHYSTRGIHEHLDKVGAAHEYHVFEGKEHKLGHVFNVLHPDWEESVAANQAILDFFEKHKK